MPNKDIYKYKAYWKVIEDSTGYDFSGYSFDSLNQRLEHFLSGESIGSPDELKEKIFFKNDLNKYNLKRLHLSYTEMFRDPDFFISFRANVYPFLSTIPKINIWHAGCSTGEEVYSLAILLDELNLLDRCDIYATDINETNLRNAIRGIYTLSNMQESAARYFRAGGKEKLSKYYTTYYDNIIFHKRLRERLHFNLHNLVVDKSENRFHFILCRNVFIYFNYELKQIVLKSLCNSLHDYGFLGMGFKDNISDITNVNLAIIDNENKIYRKSI